MSFACASSFDSSASCKQKIYSVLQVLGASCFLALCSQISIPLFFTPVPLSLQTFAVLLIGVTLGSRKGVLSVLAYLTQGCLGLPVFAGGSFGVVALYGVTGGYLLGFVCQVYLAGWFSERQKTFRESKTVVSLFFACVLQLLLGTLWLSSFVGISSALMMGFYPFLIGELLKVLTLTSYIRIRQREKHSCLSR